MRRQYPKPAGEEHQLDCALQAARLDATAHVALAHTSHLELGRGGWENSQCTSGGAATLSQNGCVMAILRLSATLVVVSILSFPLGRAPPLGHGVARDRRGRGETRLKTRTGGERNGALRMGGSGYPRTQTSQLWSAQTVHSRDLAMRCSRAGNSFHLGSVTFGAT